MSYPSFVAIGDIHLKSGHPRNGDRLAAFDAIIAAGLTIERLAAWLVLGDVFEERSSIDDRNAVADRFTRMADHAPVIVCRGNHDLYGDLNIFTRLKAKHAVLMLDRPDVIDLHHCMTRLFVLPYPSAAALVAQGTAPADIPQRAREALDAIFMQAGAQLAEARAKRWTTLCIGHATVVGAVASTGQPQMHLGLEIDGAMLARLGTEAECPKILGHIHKPQAVGGALYAGSISRNDYGEVEAKRWLLAQYQPQTKTWLITSHLLDVAPMYHVDATFREGQFTYRVADGPEGAPLAAPASWKGCDVRVRVTFAKSETAFFSMARTQIAAAFADCLRLTIEAVCVPDRALRSPEVAHARTLPEKVTAWAAIDGTVIPDAAFALLDRLEGDAEQLLTDVGQEVGALVTREEVHA